MDIHQLTAIFCEIDDFCNTLDDHTQHYMLSEPMKGHRGPSCGLAISDIMTILVMFQSSRMRDFKNFYLGLLSLYYKDYFPTHTQLCTVRALDSEGNIPTHHFYTAEIW